MDGVWVVTKWWSYEGEELCGVFTTLDKAHEYIKKESPSGKPLIPDRRDERTESWSVGLEQDAYWGWHLRLLIPDHPERTPF